MRFSLRMVFFAVLVLFLISAFVGGLISYNTSLAWSRFTAIALAVALCVFFAAMPEEQASRRRNAFPLIPFTLALLPTFLIIYFVLTNDWTARLGKVSWLDPVLKWFAMWQPQLPGLRLDSNSFGGALAMLISLQVAALWREDIARRAITAVLLLVSLLGLVISASRGAWLSIGVVAWIAGIWALLGRIVPAWQSNRERKTRLMIWSGLILLIGLTAWIALALTPVAEILLGAGGGHWVVARNSLDLVSDYPFTGLGLGAFTMAYSSYILLVHVPHTIHAHNLFLDIWLEQGLLGLGAFVGLIFIGIFNAPGSRWRFAALASLGVVLIHGLLDDAFYGYGAGALFLLLIPFGILARESSMSTVRVPRWSVPALVGTLAIIMLFVTLSPATRAMIEANLGALSQTSVELSVYRWPEWGIQDDLRRSPQIDLTPGIAHYRTAQAIDPANVTANRRLAQIELSRGEYDSASHHLESAYAIAPGQRATRQMLGESYAIVGDLGKATMLWKTIDLSENQIEIRQWWYEHIGDKVRAARLQAAMVDVSK